MTSSEHDQEAQATELKSAFSAAARLCHAWLLALVAMLATAPAVAFWLMRSPTEMPATYANTDDSQPPFQYPHFRRARPQQLQYCQAHFSAFLPNIHEDLLPWADSGVGPELMEETIRKYTVVNNNSFDAGVAFLFLGGRAHVLGAHDLRNIPYWFAEEAVMYGHVMEYLGRKYGQYIPDTLFVLQNNDEPAEYLPGLKGATPHPIFRYCRNDDAAEVTLPIWHFYEYNYSATYLQTMASRDGALPWRQRAPAAFCRPGNYHRFDLHPDGGSRATKYGEQGQRLAGPAEDGYWRDAAPREYLLQWAQRQGDARLAITDEERPLDEWARHRWVVHVDGITCSSRLEKLLTLGSLVIREESSYRSFFGRLLQPFVHYVPFWVSRPQELLQAVAWAQANDAEAQRIARNGQRLARRYLNHDGLDCYWLMLLERWSRLQRFQPHQLAEDLAQRHGADWAPQPVTTWLATLKADDLARPQERSWWREPGTLEFEDDIDVAHLPDEQDYLIMV